MTLLSIKSITLQILLWFQIVFLSREINEAVILEEHVPAAAEQLVWIYSVWLTIAFVLILIQSNPTAILAACYQGQSRDILHNSFISSINRDQCVYDRLCMMQYLAAWVIRIVEG